MSEATKKALKIDGAGKPEPKTSYFAKIPRAVVLHRMQTADCLDERLFWAIILWSWTGPQISDRAVRKNDKGFIERENAEEIPARLRDFRKLLGLPEHMQGNLSRALNRLLEQGSIRFGEPVRLHSRARWVYPVKEPEPPAPQTPPPADDSTFDGSTDIKNLVWFVGNKALSYKNLPTDPARRAEAIEFLNDVSTAWNSELKTLRTRFKKMLVQAAFEGRIIIDKNLRSKEKSSSSPPSPSQPRPRPEEEEDFSLSTKSQNQGQQPPAEPDPPPDPQPDPPEPAQAAQNGADGPAFEELRDHYPKERTDEAKARNQWKTLSAAERQKAVNGLPAFLECERWKRTPQYIPFLSNWLKNAEYRYEPPRFFEPRGKNSSRWGPSPEETDRLLNEALEAERRKKSQGRKP